MFNSLASLHSINPLLIVRTYMHSRTEKAVKNENRVNSKLSTLIIINFRIIKHESVLSALKCMVMLPAFLETIFTTRPSSPFSSHQL